MLGFRFLIAVCSTVTTFVPLATANEVQTEMRSNIVLILADDLGWTGLGCFGSEYYETPNIDRLATGGVRFTTAFSAASNCAPSRASIMSGQYTPKHLVMYVGNGNYQEKWKQKHGDLKKFKMIQPRGETALSVDIATMGEHLQKAGYRTAMFGKWHLGNRDQHPSKRGFDVAIESAGKHFGFETKPETTHPDDQYLSDFLSDRAAEFVKQAAADKQPFFLYYADFLVHKPFEAKERYLEHFHKKTPSKNHKSPMAAAMIKSLDDSVGKIIAALDESGVRNNTLVVFTSDNGGLSYEEDGDKTSNTSNLPLRGRKGSEYDGGIRVPWIVNWPGTSPAGETCSTPVHQVDLYPTFCSIAGIGKPTQELHGVDISSLFRDPNATLADRKLFWYLPGYSAFHKPSVMVRDGNWKLIRRLEDNTSLLFKTDSDIGESTDVSDDHPDQAASLNAAAMKWLDDLDARRMVPNPEYDPANTR